MTLVDDNLDWDYAFTKRLDLKAKITLKCMHGCMDIYVIGCFSSTFLSNVDCYGDQGVATM